MASTATSVLLPPPRFPAIIKPKRRCNLLTAHSSYPPLLASPLRLSSTRKTVQFRHSRWTIMERLSRIPRNNATAGEILPTETAPVETSEQIMAATDDGGVSVIISVLLTIAFVILSILTIGVIYIGVTDFLQKREREKFEKEEAAKKKKKTGKKVKTRARAGPRGFGQKIDEEDND